MEHIVQFGINLDDNAIRQSIVAQAAEECRKAIKELKGNYYDKDGIRAIVAYEASIQINRLIKENSEEIISRAVKEVANSLTRTKVFREAAGTLADEIREGRDDLSIK